MNAERNTPTIADKPLEQRRQEERERSQELRASLRRHHMQVTTERKAILHYNLHHALGMLKPLAAKRVLPGSKR